MTSIAQQLPKGLKTENEILDAGYVLMKAQLGAKAAMYYFNYDEDFPSDLISEYRWIEKQPDVCAVQ